MAAIDLATKKLASSGLTLEDAEILGIEWLEPTQTKAQHQVFKELSSLRLNYYTPEGEPIEDIPCGGAYYRIRYLEVITTGRDDGKKQPRYMQPPLTLPVAYYPRNQDWTGIVDNVEAPIIITEGELKAAAACKAGFPTIGLGGVHSWQSIKKGITWLPSLDLVKWVRRNVYICFDSDYKTNPMVCKALKEFADALHSRGAFVHLVTLPQIANLEKVGLDDFLVASGAIAPELFREMLHSAEPLGLSAPLWAMNNKYCYIKSLGMVMDQETRLMYKPGAFKEHLEVAKTYHERDLTKGGEISYKPVCAADAWLKWGLRMEAAKMEYLPGEAFFVPRDGKLLCNSWTGWAVEPVEGNVAPFLDFIEYLFEGSEPGAKEWFLRWCAYPLQNPGAKLYTSVVIQGIKQGTGKSQIGYTLKKIYGAANFSEINQSSLEGKHTGWAENKQFVMGDDVTGSNKRAYADRLKKLITQEEIWIDIKYIPEYAIKDCINYLFTTNQPDAFFLEDSDRRFFVHEVRGDPKPETYYTQYTNWLKDGGAAHVFHYLLNLPMGDFNPAGHAFKTSAKERMAAAARSELENWVRELKQNPEYVLQVSGIVTKRDLFTSKELLNAYDLDGRSGTKTNAVANAMKRAGFHPAYEYEQLRLSDGSNDRYFIVRNPQKWFGATRQTFLDHLENTKPKKSSAKF